MKNKHSFFTLAALFFLCGCAHHPDVPGINRITDAVKSRDWPAACDMTETQLSTVTHPDSYAGFTGILGFCYLLGVPPKFPKDEVYGNKLIDKSVSLGYDGVDELRKLYYESMSKQPKYNQSNTSGSDDGKKQVNSNCETRQGIAGTVISKCN